VTITNAWETSDMHHSGRRAAIAAAGLILALAAPVAAHEELTGSDPAAGSTLAEAPTEVVLTFSGELAPESGFVVVDADGDDVGVGELDLEVAERNILRGSVTITADGTYTVRWTAVAVDEHPEEGSFTFSVGEGQAPNTALSSPGPAPLAGLALLMLAGVARLALRPWRPAR
jgi:methionine-rich copper-binding protein CopC